MIETNVVRPVGDRARLDVLMGGIDMSPWSNRDGETRRGRAVVIPVGYTASWVLVGPDNLGIDLVASHGIDEVQATHQVFVTPRRHRVISEELRIAAHHTALQQKALNENGITLEEDQRLVYIGSKTSLEMSGAAHGSLRAEVIGTRTYSFNKEGDLVFGYFRDEKTKREKRARYHRTMTRLINLANAAGDSVEYFNTIENLGPMATSYGPRQVVN